MEDDGFSWAFSDVYGPVDDCERLALWEELSVVKGLWSLPWCVVGDFNVVRSPSERSIGGQWTPAMMQFSEFIDGHELIDLPLEGATFTWSSGREVPTLSRLDRFLIYGKWKEKFPDAVQAGLATVTSNHIPLVLDCGGLRPHCTPFRFENMWLRAVHFQGKVRSWWEEDMVVGTSSFILSGKLRFLKNKLKRWNKEVNGNLEWRKNRALADIAEIDRLEGGGWDGLESSFTKEEVLKALKSCNGDKAPGPDGFTMTFLLESWEVVRQEVIGTFHEFHSNGREDGFRREMEEMDRRVCFLSQIFCVGEWVSIQLMRRAMDFGFIRGFRIGPDSVQQMEISHLLFMDDTLVFCDIDVSQLRYLICVLVYFQTVSGLKVNMGKSVLVHVGEVQEVASLAAVIGCGTSSFLISYLGLPLGDSSRSVGSWNPVIKRFERRLAGWKKQYLSKGGKVTLVKSTLSNLPTYFLSLFQIPSSIVGRLEMLQRNFLWGGQGEEFKFHLVRWE
ncbi:uncharacterized protein LOC132266277 [Cornus florida]|uniref:uncharacterized protein LOC132266277 n=1 Tax=Cornus florida TaxID=4283 RepID=UPI00289F4B18|nr:uncharacterized protein LOC132266277 [Cornus florida]